MRRVAIATGGVLAALAGSCEQPRTELVVRVDSEVAWGPGQRVQSVVLTVRRIGADGPLRSARTTALGADVGRRQLPLYVGVLAAGDDIDTPVWVEALGCGAPNGCTATTAFVAQRAVVRFVRDQTQELSLLLASACVGVRCASDQQCAANGLCEAATAAQARVRPFVGNVAPIGGDAAGVVQVPIDAATVADVLTDTGRDVTVAMDAPIDTAIVMDSPAIVDLASEVAVPTDMVGAIPDDGRIPIDVPIACPSGLADCDGDASNGCESMPATDRSNCGACRRVCGSGAVCAAGTCLCPSGGLECAGACVDTNIDTMNCGTCGHPCAVGETCASGICRCLAPRMTCPGACVLSRSDRTNCGTCGRSCGVGQRCWDGACSDVSVVEVVAGVTQSCARLSDGSVRCWGRNVDGEFGDGTRVDHLVPVVVPVLAGAVRIAVGYQGSMCAQMVDNSIRCVGGVGLNSEGGGAPFGVTTTVASLGAVRQLVVGTWWACVLLSDSTVRCWGYNASGQLGNGTAAPTGTPSTVSGIRSVTAIAAGGSHVCAALEDGTVRCWGANSVGQLGDGTSINRMVPVTVLGLSGVVGLGLGQSHSCARLVDGTVQCWGNNSSGQLGDGTTRSRAVPAVVPGVSSATQVVGGMDHACALRGDRSVACWGSNQSGVLGNGSTSGNSLPTTAIGLTGAVSLTSYYLHSCALTSTGEVLCWGAGGGRLGDGTNMSRAVPTPVLW